MTKNPNNSNPDADDDDSSIDDYFDDQLLNNEVDFDSRRDKKYDKDNEDFDKKFRKKFRHKTEDRSTVEGVLDFETSREIYKFQMKGFINQFDGVVSTGKEANVYYATSKNLAETGGFSELAVKIFRTRTLDFKKIKLYIEGDIRFAKSGKKSHQIIQTWALKEYKNLMRCVEHQILVPRPLFVKRNILIMEFIGLNGIAAPQLRQFRNLPDSELQSIYNQIIDLIKRLWSDAQLVHGDLSAYNMLYHNSKVYLIDMGQAVLTNHNYADHFLVRDIENILYYFSEYEITIQTTEQLFELITGRVPDLDTLKLKL